MAEMAQFETDEFLKLLTEALRAGPGSPPWHEALLRLREANITGADEYRVLLQARERLESGRGYRSVRAGPGFTRQVMEAIERQGMAGPGRFPLATVIAVLAGMGMLAAVIVVAAMLFRGSGTRGGLAELEATYFPRTAVAGDFTDSIPLEWKPFGASPLISPRGRGLRGAFHAQQTEQYVGGGLCAAAPVAGDAPFAFEALVRMDRPTNQVDLQFFLTQDPSFSGSAAASPAGSELVVDILDGKVSVYLPDGKLVGQTADVGQQRDGHALMIKVDARFVIVESGGVRLFAGPHGLSAGRPIWPGVRFLTRGPERGLEDVTVRMLRILRP